MEQPGLPPDHPLKTAEERWTASRDWLAANDLTGLSLEVARQRTEAAGFPFRHVELDPSPIPMALSADLRPGRITATTQGGVVIRAEATN